MRLYSALFVLTPALACAAPPPVVTDMPVTGSLVAMVMGDLGAPRILLPAGADAHDYQLRPSDAAALQEAGLLIWIGPEMTPWLERAAGQVAKGESLPLLTVPGTHVQDFGEEGGHDHDHDHHGHGHAHEGIDPHAWLDPHNARLWLGAIAEALAGADPENATAYADNASRAAEGIAALDQQIAADLAPLRDKPFVVMHDAYGYFTGHYGLHPGLALSLGDAAAPSAAQIAAIRAEIGSEGVTCLFPEPSTNPGLVAAVAEGSSIRIGAPLDPEGSALDHGAGLYPAVLTGLAEALADCFAAE